MKKKTVLDLDNGEKGEIITVKCMGQTRARLMSLGMIPGRVVTCVDKIPRGPVILKVHELTIAIGRRTASMCECMCHSARYDTEER